MEQPGVSRAVSGSSNESNVHQKRSMVYEEIPGSMSSSRPLGYRNSSVPTTNDSDNDGSDSDDSITAEQKKRAAEKLAMEKAADGFVEDAASPLVNRSDLEYYRKRLDTPVVKTAGALVAAATAGAVIASGAGLLVGAATVCIGAGVMQIPEKERNNVGNKVKGAISSAQESIFSASENICAASCGGHPDRLFPDDICVSSNNPSDLGSLAGNTSMQGSVKSNGMGDPNNNTNNKNNGTGMGMADRRIGQSVSGGGLTNGNDNRSTSSPTNFSKQSRRIACLRTVRVLPITQIHALSPPLQPKAWLDVMANAHTSKDEKMEAMEEIVILAKDKVRREE